MENGKCLNCGNELKIIKTNDTHFIKKCFKCNFETNEPKPIHKQKKKKTLLQRILNK